MTSNALFFIRAVALFFIRVVVCGAQEHAVSLGAYVSEDNVGDASTTLDMVLSGKPGEVIAGKKYYDRLVREVKAELKSYLSDAHRSDSRGVHDLVTSVDIVRAHDSVGEFDRSYLNAPPDKKLRGCYDRAIQDVWEWPMLNWRELSTHVTKFALDMHEAGRDVNPYALGHVFWSLRGRTQLTGIYPACDTASRAVGSYKTGQYGQAISLLRKAVRFCEEHPVCDDKHEKMICECERFIRQSRASGMLRVITQDIDSYAQGGTRDSFREDVIKTRMRDIDSALKTQRHALHNDYVHLAYRFGELLRKR